VGEVGLDSRENIGGGKPGDSSHQLHQGTNLTGCSSLSVDNRIDHVGDVIDHADSNPISCYPFFSEYRSGTIKDPLASIKAGE
jgi:hypothetical protein